VRTFQAVHLTGAFHDCHFPEWGSKGILIWINFCATDCGSLGCSNYCFIFLHSVYAMKIPQS
jgi:hypothetical protein